MSKFKDIFFKWRIRGFWANAQGKYAKIHARDKWITLTLLSAFTAVLAWQTPVGTIVNPAIMALITAGALFAIHAMLTWASWLKAGFVWLFLIVALPSLAALYAVSVPAQESAWTFAQTTVTGFSMSLIFTIAATRWGKGKLWVTLTVTFLAAFLASVIVISLTKNVWLAAGAYALAGSLAVAIRMKFPRESLSSLEYATVEEARVMTEVLRKELDLRSLTLLDGGSDNEVVTLSVNRQGQLITVLHVKTKKPLTFDSKGRILSGKTDIKGIFGHAFLLSQQLLGDKVPFITLIAMSGDYTVSQRRYVPMSITSRMGETVGTVGLVSSAHIADGVSRALLDILPKAATKKQIDSLGHKLAYK